ncbi:unnamed protein product, partial [Trichogramma brassicae]
MFEYQRKMLPTATPVQMRSYGWLGAASQYKTLGIDKFCFVCGDKPRVSYIVTRSCPGTGGRPIQSHTSFPAALGYERRTVARH